MFSNLIKLCRFSKNEADDKKFPIQQVEYLEKTCDSFVIMPYGVHANVPEDYLGIVFQVSNQEQNRIVFPLSFEQRPSKISSGEIVMFHPITGSKIYFKNNGNIEITTENDVDVNCNNANVIAKTKASVTAPDIDLTGDVNITGKLDVSGISNFASNIIAGANVTVTGALSQGGKDVGATHNHPAGTPPGNTGAVN